MKKVTLDEVKEQVEFRIGKGNLNRLYGDYTPTKEELIKDAGLYAAKTKNINKKDFVKYILTQISSK